MLARVVDARAERLGRVPAEDVDPRLGLELDGVGGDDVEHLARGRLQRVAEALDAHLQVEHRPHVGPRGGGDGDGAEHDRIRHESAAHPEGTQHEGGAW
eukprot:scaffold98323_cov69-Phaeocystis_antarctica.AAC.4